MLRLTSASESKIVCMSSESGAATEEREVTTSRYVPLEWCVPFLLANLGSAATSVAERKVKTFMLLSLHAQFHFMLRSTSPSEFRVACLFLPWSPTSAVERGHNFM